MGFEHDPGGVVFIDEFPRFIERRQVKLALGQLTLEYNTNPNQLALFMTPIVRELPPTPPPAA